MNFFITILEPILVVLTTSLLTDAILLFQESRSFSESSTAQQIEFVLNQGYVANQVVLTLKKDALAAAMTVEDLEIDVCVTPSTGATTPGSTAGTPRPTGPPTTGLPGVTTTTPRITTTPGGNFFWDNLHEH